MGNLRLAQVPKEHQTALFTNLLQLRGVNAARQLVEENALLAASFPWVFSNEGHNFWQAIEDGESPNITTKTTGNELDELVKEAESKGFALGVSTKFGIIRERGRDGKLFGHELCDDGSFFYHNIKVRNAKGKWCKPNKPEKRGQSLDASAIHEMLHEVFKLRKN